MKGTLWSMASFHYISSSLYYVIYLLSYKYRLHTEGEVAQ